MVLAAVPALPVCAAGPVPLAEGDRLPALAGDLLSGRRWVVPDSTSGRPVLLLLGFTYESRLDVAEWAGAFRRRFGPAPGVELLEVPVIGTPGRLGRPFIERAMRRGMPRQEHDGVLMVYRDAGRWKRLAGYRAKDVAYVLLVGPDGRLAWRGSGPFRDAAWESLAVRLAGPSRRGAR